MPLKLSIKTNNMKRILIITSLFLLSFTTGEKSYDIKLNENQVQMFWTSLECAKINLQTSQAPANDVKNVTKIIDSLQSLIRVQYVKQLKDTTK